MYIRLFSHSIFGIRKVQNWPKRAKKWPINFIDNIRPPCARAIARPPVPRFPPD